MTGSFILLLVLPLIFAIGEPLAKLLQFQKIEDALHRLVRSLRKKLNRSERSASKRAWRGVIAFCMLATPAVILGLYLQYGAPWLNLLALLLTIALFGHILRPHSMYRLWQQAKDNRLPLQLGAPYFLFADTHAVLRYLIVSGADTFAALFVGGILYHVLGGLPLMLAYLILALCAAHYSPRIEENKVFGGAVYSLFQIVAFPPRLLAGILLFLAGIFTAKTRPFGALLTLFSRARSFDLFVAELMDVSFGGMIPSAVGQYDMKWVGDGTPKPKAADFGRWLILSFTASFLLWLSAISIILFIVLTGS